MNYLVQKRLLNERAQWSSSKHMRTGELRSVIWWLNGKILTCFASRMYTSCWLLST